ncbi:MAG TPA: hypothetical protein VGO93_28695 [Candidatus Xenobia bacterium]|jgi:hypothetical protein
MATTPVNTHTQAFEEAYQAHERAASEVAAYETALREAQRLHAIAHASSAEAHQRAREAHLAALTAGEETPDWIYTPPARPVAPFVLDVAAVVGA